MERLGCFFVRLKEAKGAIISNGGTLDSAGALHIKSSYALEVENGDHLEEMGSLMVGEEDGNNGLNIEFVYPELKL